MSVTCRQCRIEFTPSLRAGGNTYRGHFRARLSRWGKYVHGLAPKSQHTYTDAKFCSAACKQAAYRARVKAREAEAPRQAVTPASARGARPPRKRFPEPRKTLLGRL
jgi:hypothetical protein